MNLVDEYLRAVSILLPAAQREDIVAELRDTILSRIEAREAELGRALTDEETEAVLREIGHPVVVAARYREGPQHVVGPALYPFWVFALKVGFAIQVAAALIVLIVQVVAFGDFGLALGRATSSVVSGGIALVGVATIVAWLVERQGVRIGYLDTWRVRDLWFLEFVAWDWDTLRSWFSGRGWPGQPHRPPSQRPPSQTPPSQKPPSSGSASAGSSSAGPAAAARPSQPGADTRPRRGPPPAGEAYAPAPWPARWSPAGHGLMLIAAGAVLLMWWMGLTRFDLSLSAAGLQSQGFEPGALASVDWDALRAELFWPVLAYGVWTVLRGAVQLAHPWAVRLQGFLDAISGAALAGFGAWLWTASPLSPAVRVDGLAEFVSRLAPFEGHAIPLPPLATVVVAAIFIAGLSRLLRGLWDMLAGPPPFGPWAVGI